MLNSTTKTLALALVTGSLLAGTMAAPSYARDGNGPPRHVREHNCEVHCPRAKKLKKDRNVNKKNARKARRARERSWASSYDPETGRRITAIDNGDRTRTVIGIGAGFGPFGIQIWQSR